jgi:hypothetical protein
VVDLVSQLRYNQTMPTNVPMCQRYPRSFGGPDRDAHVVEYRTFLRTLLKRLNSAAKDWSGKLTYSGGPAVIPSVFIKLIRASDGRAIEILNTPSDDDERAMCLVRQIVPSEHLGHNDSGPNHTAYTLERVAELSIALSAIPLHRDTCAHCKANTSLLVPREESRALHGWPVPPLAAARENTVATVQHVDVATQQNSVKPSLRSLRSLPKRTP